ncbi:hypothetical protein XELAEV_18018888mg [Xenopus laevis]|uniref:AB hydrolase-1 domain-containing protein n=1 Tax=Xenopus laevis TaxID=8355 RepID=A0A974DG64_XENLA|nr:hypothetical protein XELAEV_18018888mg [Xenopus laevis]
MLAPLQAQCTCSPCALLMAALLLHIVMPSSDSNTSCNYNPQTHTAASFGAIIPNASQMHFDHHKFFPVKVQDVLVPTLLLWGECDALLEVAMMSEMQQYIHAPFTAEIIPDASHWLQQDRPQEVNRITRDFLKEVFHVHRN